MAITQSTGYGGSIDETEWANLPPLLGSSYGVVDEDDWRVTAVPAADRTVSIAAGVGWGRNVRDVNDGPVTLQGDVVASGSRWDLVVARRNWELEGGKTTFEIVKGGASRSIPAGRNIGPGILDDQPLALVRFAAGQQLPAEIVDMRCWPGNGGLIAATKDALAYLGRLGSRVSVDGVMWERRISGGAASWVRPRVDAELLEGTVGRPVDNSSNQNYMNRLTLRNPPEFSARPNVYMSSSGQIGRTDYVEEEQTGEVSVSFTNRNFYTRQVNFTPGRFRGRPVVTCNILSGGGATARWDARSININEDGFTLFLYTGDDGAASTWDKVTVQWHARRRP